MIFSDRAKERKRSCRTLPYWGCWKSWLEGVSAWFCLPISLRWHRGRAFRPLHSCVECNRARKLDWTRQILCVRMMTFHEDLLKNEIVFFLVVADNESLSSQVHPGAFIRGQWTCCRGIKENPPCEPATWIPNNNPLPGRPAFYYLYDWRL